MPNPLYSLLPQAASNVLGGSGLKAPEAAKKLYAQHGSAVREKFNKLAGKAPTLDKTGADQLKKRAELAASDTTTRVTSELDDEIRAMAGDPYSGTDIDRDTADQEALRQLEGADVGAQTMGQTVQTAANDTGHMVKLYDKDGHEVVFRVMPEVVESRTVEYEAVAPPQSPSAFQKYKGTSSTQWSVNATLVCRTTEEANENLRFINQLRGWTMPFFGSPTALQYPKKIGAPPPVLTFSGWRAKMVGPVQVVITSLNWNFPQDVDYIPADGDNGQRIPFPTVIKVAIQLVESFSTDQLNGFSLDDFTAGRFDKAFASATRVTKSPSGTTAPRQEAQTFNPAARVETERGRRTNTNPLPLVVSEPEYVEPTQYIDYNTGRTFN